MIFEHFYQRLTKGWRRRGGWQNRVRTHPTAWISNNQINVLDVYRLTVFEKISIEVTALRLVCVSYRHFVSVISAMWTWAWFTTNCGLNNCFVFYIFYTLNYKRVITSDVQFSYKYFVICDSRVLGSKELCGEHRIGFWSQRCSFHYNGLSVELHNICKFFKICN